MHGAADHQQEERRKSTKGIKRTKEGLHGEALLFCFLALHMIMVEMAVNSRTGGIAGRELFQSNANTHINLCYSSRVVFKTSFPSSMWYTLSH